MAEQRGVDMATEAARAARAAQAAEPNEGAQTTPQEGERYTKDGITCVVHFVSHGHVHGHRHRAGEDDPPLDPHSLERLVRPNRFRISLPEWYAQTAGAVKS